MEPCISTAELGYMYNEFTGTMEIWGRIFSQAGNELGASSFLAMHILLNVVPIYLVPSWERACSKND